MLKLNAISKHYGNGGGLVSVLNEVNIAVEAGEALALIGPSGVGKSTLLHIAGLLMAADSGSVEIDGEIINHTSDLKRTATRRRKLGFIYQFHHLLSDFNALENVMIPLLLNDFSRSQAKDRATDMLKRVDLENRMSHFPAQLSGGEQQRVAVARALIHQPKIILADEPTGNLDPETGRLVAELLFSECRNHGSALVMVTHNPALAALADRIHRLD